MAGEQWRGPTAARICAGGREAVQGDAGKGGANKRNATACIHLVVLSPWWTNGPKKQFEMNTPCVFCLEEKKIKLWIFYI